MESQGLVARLQEKLRADERQLIVNNYAVPGYDTLESVHRLGVLSTRLPTPPAVIVYVFCTNDLTVARPAADVTRAYNMEPHSLLWKYSVLWRFLYMSQLLRASQPQSFDEVASASERAVIPEGDHAHRAIDRLTTLLGRSPKLPTFMPYQRVSHVAHFRFALQRLAGFARENRAEVVVLYTPEFIEHTEPVLQDAARTVKALVEHEVRRLGFTWVDPEQPLSRHPGGLASLGVDPQRDNIHPTRVGHEILAESLLPAVRAALDRAYGPPR